MLIFFFSQTKIYEVFSKCEIIAIFKQYFITESKNKDIMNYHLEILKHR